MKPRTVVLSPEARDDLIALYDWITDATSPQVAGSYLDRIEGWLRGFDIASERGTLREDIRPGLRMVGFERRLTVAFSVDETQVTILRVFRAGRHWEEDLADE